MDQIINSKKFNNKTILLILSIAICYLFTLDWFGSMFLNIQKPDKAAKIITTHIENSINEIENVHNSLDYNANQKIFINNIQKATIPFVDQILFYKDSIEYWSNNSIIPDSIINKYDSLAAFENKNWSFLQYKKKISKDSNYSVLYILPIKKKYISNYDFVEKHFLFDYKIPESWNLSLQKSINKTPIYFKNFFLFSIDTSNDLLFSKTNPPLNLLFTIIPLFFFILLLHQLFFNHLIKKYNKIKLFFIFISILAFIRFINYFFNFPSIFYNYELFSPTIYAHDFINKSLGDLLYNLLLFWLILLILRVRILKPGIINKSFIFHFILGLASIFIITAIAYWFYTLIYDLLINSPIQINVHALLSINFYTIIVLGIIVLCFNILLSLSSILFECFYNYNTFKLKFNSTFILLAILLFFLILLIYGAVIDTFLMVYFAWLGFVLIFNSNKNFRTRHDPFSIKFLLWVMFFSFSISIFLQLSNIKKEEKLALVLAKKILNLNSSDSKSKQDEFSSGISKDTLIGNLVTNNNSSLLFNYIQTNYLTKYFPEKQVQYLILNGKNDIIVSSDSVNQNQQKAFFKSLNFKSSWNIDSNNNCSFINIPISNDKKQIGIFQISLSNINDYSTSMYNNLLNSLNSPLADFLQNYIVTYYQNGLLAFKNGYSNLPYIIHIPINSFTYKQNGFIYYSYSDINKNAVVLSKKLNLMEDFAILFAYVFTFSFFVSLIVLFLYFFSLSKFNFKNFVRLINLNYKLRILYSIYFIELFVFTIVILLSSIIFNENQFNKYQQIIFNKSVYFNSVVNNILNSKFKIDKISDNNFGNTLDSLTTNEKFLFNIYNLNGSLIYSSKKAQYQKNIFTSKIKYSILASLNANKNLDYIINDEANDHLHYLSSYTFVRSKNLQNPIAICNITNPLLQPEIKNEKAKYLATLFDAFTFVFLISGILSYFISEYLSQTFKLLTLKFKNFNLNNSNDKIEWAYNDEIGLLINEYNLLVNKLELSVQELAKTERDLAWREMAKQVAHEIKNPLTPMKLSMQYLQNAIKNNNENYKELAENVANTIILQIDNLNNIATNFAQYGMFPKENIELINLNEFLQAELNLYLSNNDNINIIYTPNPIEVYVYIDKSQLSRVIINLISNAKQAVSEISNPNITIQHVIYDNTTSIQVADNGVGIDITIKDKIFSPNFTTKNSGTGLGLAMSKTIIENANGFIWFTSTPNDGTIFYVDLPIINFV